MTDVLTPEQRRRCMANIKGRNTKPEMVVRRLVRALGYRYALHGKKLPGKPDIVLSRLKKVIFVHGCFWHKHRCKYGRVEPKTHAEFWSEKREANRLRDIRNRRQLVKIGWSLLVVWECQTRRKSSIVALEQRLSDFLHT